MIRFGPELGLTTSARLRDARAFHSSGQYCVSRPVRDCPLLARTVAAPTVSASSLRFSFPLGGYRPPSHLNKGPMFSDGPQTIRRLRQWLRRHLLSPNLPERVVSGVTLSIGPGYSSRAWAWAFTKSRTPDPRPAGAVGLPAGRLYAGDRNNEIPCDTALHPFLSESVPPSQVHTAVIHYSGSS